MRRRKEETLRKRTRADGDANLTEGKQFPAEPGKTPPASRGRSGFRRDTARPASWWFGFRDGHESDNIRCAQSTKRKVPRNLPRLNNAAARRKEWSEL